MTGPELILVVDGLMRELIGKVADRRTAELVQKIQLYNQQLHSYCQQCERQIAELQAQLRDVNSTREKKTPVVVRHGAQETPKIEIVYDGPPPPMNII